MPTWIGGAGALAAGWFAFQTIKSQRQQIGEQQDFIQVRFEFMEDQRQNLELERTELRAQAEERRISQARQISVWFGTAGSSGTDEYGDETGYDRWDVEIVNSSDGPIHNVTVRFGDDYNAVTATARSGQEHPDRGVRPVPVPLIAKRDAVTFTSPRLSEDAIVNNRPVLYFTDDGAVRWRRDSYEKLEEVPADGTP